MRLPMLLSVLVILSGCHRQPDAPAIRPISKISARIHAVPQRGLATLDRVEVPETELAAFATLITPTEQYVQHINPELHYHIADVFVKHPDGTTTTLMIRDAGVNPAAISLDGRDYFYGGRDEFHDGATRIIHLLQQYDYEAQK